MKPLAEYRGSQEKNEGHDREDEESAGHRERLGAEDPQAPPCCAALAVGTLAWANPHYLGQETWFPTCCFPMT